MFVYRNLRGNGGGSLAEALKLTGFFIDEGPVVQTKDATGKVEINYDPQPGIVYSGPLAVLVDKNSASASEIFAGAIQDYHRGIIIGETTFGKGTVQNVIDLNRFINNNGDNDSIIGELNSLREVVKEKALLFKKIRLARLDRLAELSRRARQAKLQFQRGKYFVL